MGEQVGSIIGEDLARAEMLAFPIIFLLSLWVFRGFVAALLPSLMGGVVIFGSFLAIGLVNEGLTLSVYALNLAIGLSLGLAIDYSLLIISRYREEIAARGPGREALARTLQTAGRSVLFSAVTVAAALAGLMVFPQRFLFSMGLAGVMVALIAAAHRPARAPRRAGAARHAASTAARRGSSSGRSEHADERGHVRLLVPPVQRRHAAPGRRRRRHGHRAGDRRPAGPRHQLHLGGRERAPHERDRPPGVGHHRPRLLRRTVSEPIYLAIDAPDTPEARAELTAYAQRLRALPDAALVTPPAVVGDGTWRIDVYADAPSLDEATQDLVAAVRDVAGALPDARRRPVGQLRGPEGQPRGAPALGHPRDRARRRSSPCSS